MGVLLYVLSVFLLFMLAGQRSKLLKDLFFLLPGDGF
jgi:hypothetical protein